MAMRRIGMCEQAGTGLRMMRREWQALGHAAPTYASDRAHKAFETFLPEPRAVAAPEVTPEVTPEIRRLLNAIHGEMSRRELQTALDLKDDDHVREAYLLPALAAGVIEMTRPEKPRSRSQRYRLTELGRRTRAALDVPVQGWC
jgi:ATP-dependent DNA helicase RecG